MENKTLKLNGRCVDFSEERNLLEVIRKAHIDLPTFCYHSELSIYGACRLCIVDIKGKGIVSSCTTKPEAGMEVLTSTEEIREIRKMTMELLLADHNGNCSSCNKSGYCKLQEIARKLNVTDVRFKKTDKNYPIDDSTYGIIRDPNKCILCGDCVRACSEIQGIGAIDFAYRGHSLQVVPSFGRLLNDVSCVECGQCVRVCPTGAITPRSDIDEVWKAIDNPNKYVVVQVAPAIRVALGEMFGFEPGTIVTDLMVAALKMLGFKKVFDTSFAADLTVIEETNEFIARKKIGNNLPLITSCCPGWVNYAEFNFPEFLPNLSTCKSPQQMFGALVKSELPSKLGINKEDLVIVSVMPCTAKRSESERLQFKTEAGKDVDFVLTTTELGTMIKQAGINFKELQAEAFDLPFGFKTGAAVIFGNSGGVSEAVVRYAGELLTGSTPQSDDVTVVRGNKGIKTVALTLGDISINLGIVYGLKNAKVLLNQVAKGEVALDLIEIMACPGGCVNGGGQPASFDDKVHLARAQGLYRSDKNLQLHRSQDNPYINSLYASLLGSPNSHKAHELLHTHYKNRSVIFEGDVALISSEAHIVQVRVCVGPHCLSRGSEKLLEQLVEYVDKQKLHKSISVIAYNRHDDCEQGVTVEVNSHILNHANFENVVSVIEQELTAVEV